MSYTTPSIYVLIGSPGAGKGTLAQSIKNKGYDHLSLGDALRAEVTNKTDFGLKYADAIINHKKGIIPVGAIQTLVIQRVDRALSFARGIVIDGFPQNVEQSAFLDNYFERKKLQGRVAFIFLDVSAETAIRRISYRQVCEKCQHIYNSQVLPSKIQNQCDHCIGKLVQRLGDEPEKIAKRISDFHTNLRPVIQYYKTKGHLIQIDGNAEPKICAERLFTLHQKPIYCVSLYVCIFAMAVFGILLRSKSNMK